MLKALSINYQTSKVGKIKGVLFPNSGHFLRLIPDALSGIGKVISFFDRLIPDIVFEYEIGLVSRGVFLPIRAGIAIGPVFP